MTLEVFDEMVSKDITPGKSCYGAALGVCENGLQWKRAAELLQRMIDTKVEPDVVHYSVLFLVA